MTGRIAGATFRFGLTLGLAACATPPGPAADPAPFVLTATGDYVLSDAPPGIEVTLGSKQVHPMHGADAPAPEPPP
jgi:hypothetical protein